MCGGCENCAKCNNADGTPQNYDPVLVGQWIQKHLLPNGSVNDIKEAYPKVMLYLESKGLPVSEASIANNIDSLKNVINDPSYLDKMSNNGKVNLKTLLAIVVILIIVIVLIKNS